MSEVIYKDHNAIGVITGIDPDENPGHVYMVVHANMIKWIEFQNGPVKDNGVNGLTNEALLAILIHRTKILNDNFPCMENRLAIDYMEKALEQFENRTKDRLDRGVEGQNLN